MEKAIISVAVLVILFCSSCSSPDQAASRYSAIGDIKLPAKMQVNNADATAIEKAFAKHAPDFKITSIMKVTPDKVSVSAADKAMPIFSVMPMYFVRKGDTWVYSGDMRPGGR